jgi:hypothetical protein
LKRGVFFEVEEALIPNYMRGQQQPLLPPISRIFGQVGQILSRHKEKMESAAPTRRA